MRLCQINSLCMEVLAKSELDPEKKLGYGLMQRNSLTTQFTEINTMNIDSQQRTPGDISLIMFNV